MELTRADQFERFATVGGGGYIVAELPQVFDEDFASYAIVVDY